jgi:hypothetical protein
MQVIVDKRLELIEALVLAVKEKFNIKSEELDFIEHPNISYVNELIASIHIEKYPQIKQFIGDSNLDCGYYTNLFVYFDNEMNYLDNYDIKVFSKGSNKEFGNLVKTIYDKENLNNIFNKYQNEFYELTNTLKNIEACDLNDIQAFYNLNEINVSCVASLLINGGFSANKDNNITYVRGIGYKDGKYITNEDYNIICLFHEASHYYINKLVDKYYNKFTNLNRLYIEAVNNGLPKTYDKVKTLLCEYFVRANAQIMAKKYISKKEYDASLNWCEKFGFIHIRTLINLTDKYLNNYNNYEYLFSQELIGFINTIKI